MNFLIDRQAAINVVKDVYKGICGEDAEGWIIKGLEDLPSIETPMDALEYWRSLALSYEHTINKLTKAISEQPTEQHWIPCSENLPEKGEIVLVTMIGGSIVFQREGETLAEAIERCKKFGRVSIGCVDDNGWQILDCLHFSVTPCAWMPLPEPYNEKKETENEN